MEDKLVLNEEQRRGLSNLGRTLLWLLIVDVMIVLFISFGMVFPSKVSAQSSPRSIASAEALKSSPIGKVQKSRNVAKRRPAVVSARSLPLNTTYQPQVQIPDANPPMPKRTM